MDRIVLDAWPVVLFCDFSLELFGRVLVFGVFCIYIIHTIDLSHRFDLSRLLARCAPIQGWSMIVD
jgi:hypothetical protein